MANKNSLVRDRVLIEPEYNESFRCQNKRRRLISRGCDKKTVVEALLSLCNDKTQSGKPLLHPTNFFSFPKTTPRRRTAATSENTGAAPVSDDEEETSTANTVMTYINHRKRENNIPQNFVLDLKFKLPQGRPLAPAPLFPTALPDPNQTSLKSHNS